MWILQLVVILCAARIAGTVAQLLGQVRVVGELAAGFLLGPSIFGSLCPNWYQILFAPTQQNSLAQFGDVGMMFLMFQVGSHLSLGEVASLRQKCSVIAVAAGGMLVPFALGVSIGLVSHSLLASDKPRVSYALFCGIALSVTAVPVLARMILELQLEKTPASIVSLAAAAATDFASWILLAVIIAFASTQHDWTQIVWRTVAALAYAALSWWIVRPCLHKLFAYTARCASPGSVTALMIIYLLASSALTAQLGFHAAMGALLAGIVLKRQPDVRRESAIYVSGFVDIILVPVFFTYAGIHVTLDGVGANSFWIWFAAFLVAGCVGKLGGAYAGARISGLPHDDSCIIAALMNTRGLVELTILLIGLDLHILPTPVYAMLLLMALVTTAATVPLLRLWISKDRFAVVVERRFTSSDT
jgi:Kef-type K+ transport system membrane component KefB